jgi:hypothetical protein
MRFVLLTHPVILLLAREVVAERPVMLLVSENKSVSFSSAAYVPSVGKGLTKESNELCRDGT